MRDKESNILKIGRSEDPRRRLKQIQQTQNRELELLMVFPNMATAEYKVHNCPYMYPYKVGREWYVNDPKVFHNLLCVVFYHYAEREMNLPGYQWINLPKDFYEEIKRKWEQYYKSVKDYR